MKTHKETVPEAPLHTAVSTANPAPFFKKKEEKAPAIGGNI